MNKKQVLTFGLIGVLGLSAIGVSTLQKPNVTVEANTNQNQILPTKEEIQFKMLNAIDYYESVQSKVTHHYEELDFDTIVESNIDLNHFTSYIKVQDIKNGEVIRNFESGFNPETGEFIDIQHHKKSYIAAPVNGFTVSEVKNLSQLKNTQKTSFLEKYPTVASRYEQSDGKQTVVLRPDPVCMRIAATMTFPQAIALNYLQDPTLWEIQGKENLLNRQAIVISGQFKEGSIAPIRTATSFKLWVDESTGILLKYESYAENGELRDQSLTESIQIDQPSTRTLMPQVPTIPECYKHSPTPGTN